MLIAHHTRSGVVALNVVTAAVQADPRTAHLPVVFARDRAEVLAALTPDALVFWSFYSPDFEAAAADLRWIRERSAHGTHVAGGVHASAEPLQTLRAGFDFAAIGEGEATSAALARGEDPRTLQGIAWLEAGRLRSNGPGERRPLDDFPGVNAAAGKWNALEITRGCIYACSFCQTPFMFKARFRHRSVENIRAHVKLLNGAGYLRFLSPTCLSYGSSDTSVNLDAVSAMLAAVREELPAPGKIFFGTFPSECRPEHVTPASLAVLKRFIDNDALVIGGQSGSERVLRETHRGHSVEDVIAAVRYTLEAGLRPDVDFLLGVPGETPEDRELSLGLARKLVALGARIHSHAFMPLPGTPLRGQIPEVLEPQIVRGLEQLESAGASYGQWRKHVEIAGRLVRLTGVSEPGSLDSRAAEDGGTRPVQLSGSRSSSPPPDNDLPKR